MKVEFGGFFLFYSFFSKGDKNEGSASGADDCSFQSSYVLLNYSDESIELLMGWVFLVFFVVMDSKRGDIDNVGFSM